MSRRRKFKANPEPTRCKCEGGGDRAKEHGKPGSKAADHGDPFGRKVRPCIHSELQLTTEERRKPVTAKRLRLQ